MLSGYQTVLRGRSPPATSRAPAPSASSDAPPVGGSVAALAEALAEALLVALLVALVVALVVAETVTVVVPPLFTLKPPRQALTCAWVIPSSWEISAAAALLKPLAFALASPY